jgi:hypothetical protein
MSPTIQEKMNLVKSLELPNQENEMRKVITSQKIDKEIQGLPYKEITPKDIDKLFGINRELSNVIAAVIMLISLVAFIGFFGSFLVNKMPVALPAMCWVLASVVGLLVVMLEAAIYDVISPNNIRIKYDDLKETNKIMPYGVLLKYQEAKQSGKFCDYKIAYPERLKKEYTDPALLGITKDNRTFLITYWDIEKDIESYHKKSIKNQEMFPWQNG